MIMRNKLHFITFFTALALIAGCGDGKLATLKVTGTITLDGKPLPGANVNFSPKSVGEGDAAYAVTNVDGHYTLQTALGKVDAGTTPGEYFVTVTKMEESAPPVAASDSDTGMSSGTPPPPKSLIPERYGRVGTSDLTANIEKGQPNVFNFDLKSQ